MSVKTVKKPPRTKLYLTILIMVLFLIGSIYQTEATLTKLISGTPEIFKFIAEMFPPDWQFFADIWKPMAETLQMSIIGTIVGALFAYPMALLAARNVNTTPWLFYPARLLMNLCRTIPDLLYAAIFAVLVGFGPTAGTLALIFFTFGILSKLSYESTEAIDPGPLEAMTAVGANKLKLIRFGVIPQVAPTYLAHLLYTFEVSIRASAILGLVGAGGIGLLLKNSLDLFRYDQACAIVIYTLIVVVIIDLISTRFRSFLLKGSAKPVSASRSKSYMIIGWLVVIALLIWSFTGLKLTGFQPTTWILTKAMFKGLTHPDWAYVYIPEGEDLIRSLLETLSISYLGNFVSAIVCLPFAFWAASNLSRRRAVSGSGKLFLSVVRTIPEIIMALIFIKAVGPGAFAGVMALGLHSVGMLGKLYAEAIENMDMGPTEAMTAVGANVWQKMAFAIVPQVIPDFISYTLFRFEINVRSATLLGVIGAGGIGTPLVFAINARQWPRVGIIIIGIIITVSIIDYISATLRKRIV
ncbi:phosphonate ABC transporter, permease protein PhnE [Paenibacillus sp. N3.4]|uniref:phosphonate ABC transporter, permease protein PhnE n=1 Tax=Paenibacillus sp. N3.4 TaxID=2603222 RepID=UPI0011CCB80E|nr:phosphonate ABC transporter, permease protein PhnE [Paenibacillus sp. N3.4]